VLTGDTADFHHFAKTQGTRAAAPAGLLGAPRVRGVPRRSLPHVGPWGLPTQRLPCPSQRQQSYGQKPRRSKGEGGGQRPHKAASLGGSGTCQIRVQIPLCPWTLGGPEQDTSLASASRPYAGTGVPPVHRAAARKTSESMKGMSIHLVARPPSGPGRQQTGRRGEEEGLRPPQRARLSLGLCLFGTGPAPGPAPGTRLSWGK